MVAIIAKDEIQILRVEQEIHISAPIDVAFSALLEQLGPENELPDRTPMPMVLEAWPGGRWFRDLGQQGEHPAGHFWGHVQVIKSPKLLELTGPLFMSYPSANHLQYRLTQEGVTTKLSLVHRGFGEIPADHREGVRVGWMHGLQKIKEIAESRQERK